MAEPRFYRLRHFVPLHQPRFLTNNLGGTFNTTSLRQHPLTERHRAVTIRSAPREIITGAASTLQGNN
jgi:hypothetical protein